MKRRIEDLKVLFKFSECEEFLDADVPEDLQKARKIIKAKKPIIFLKEGG